MDIGLENSKIQGSEGVVNLEPVKSDERPSSYRYVVEVIVFLTFATFGMTWAAAGTFLTQFMEDLGLSLSAASFISTIVSIANIFGPAVAGLIMTKFGIRWAFMLASALICLGILAPISPNYYLILLARFAMGLGGALVLVYLTPITMQWFSGSERVTMNGLNFLSSTFGMMVATFITPPIQRMFGGSWKMTLIVYGTASILLAVAWLVFGREKDESPSAKNEASDDSNSIKGYMDAIKNKNTWFLILSGMGSLSFFVSLFTYFPTFYSQLFANVEGFWLKNPTGVTLFTTLPASVLGIIITERMGLRTPVMRLAALILYPAALGMLILKTPTPLFISSVLAGVGLQIGVAAFYCIPQELPGITPQKAGYIMGVFWAAVYTIATFNVWLAGVIIEKTGNNFMAGFTYILIVGSLSIIGIFLLPETGPKRKAVITI
jgi:MFS transporter, CP family, cyanate transporter